MALKNKYKQVNKIEKIKEFLSTINKEKIIIYIIALGFIILFLSMIHKDATLEREISILRTEKADKKKVDRLETIIDILTGDKESNEKPPAEFITK